jgi:hypothetical protein
MGNLLAPFVHQLLLGLVVFVVLFVVIGALLARSRFGGMVGGLLRVIASCFYSPFLYLRKGVGELADYAHEGERRFAHTDQYLLRKVLLMLIGALLLGSIGVLTIGGMGAWTHAREWLRLQTQQHRIAVEITEQEAEKARLASYLAGLDDQWQNQREILIAGYQRTREHTADSLRSANRGLTTQIQRVGESDAPTAQLFPGLVGFLQSNEENPLGYLGYVRDRALQAIDQSPIVDTCKTMMNRYVENWYQGRLMLEDPRMMGDEALRRVLQPTRPDSMARVEYLERAIPQDRERQAALRADAREQGRGVTREPVRAFLRFLLVVWIGGMAIEALALAVLTAANIQRLRERADAAGDTAESGNPPSA